VPRSMAALDSRIRVWWTEEKAWYAGRVVSSERGVHTVAYDDGVSLTHDLLKETWETEPVPKRKAEAPKADAPKKRAKKQPPAQEQAAEAPPPRAKQPAASRQVKAAQQAPSEYELQRDRNIAENQQKLADLGLNSARDNCRAARNPAKVLGVRVS
jgi:hypothetical protein